MDYNKHTDEVLERLQAQQVLEILAMANKSISHALTQIQELEHNSMMYLDTRPTREIMDDINALHLHLHFLDSAKSFAKNEIHEIGFYLN
jgi:predicted GTPase